MRQISVNYAHVLSELAVPIDDLKKTEKLLREVPVLKEALKNPLVSMAEKERIVDRVFSETVRNFLKAACLHERTEQIEEIVECYEEYIRGQNGILSVRLLCVTLPSEAQLQGIKKFLCRKYGKKDVFFEIEKDSSLLGGFILKAGDFEYDYSLKGRMEGLQRQLTRR